MTKVLVKKDFYMEDGELSFKAGKSYDFTLEDPNEALFVAIDEQGDSHLMELRHMLKLNEEFIQE